MIFDCEKNDKYLKRRDFIRKTAGIAGVAGVACLNLPVVSLLNSCDTYFEKAIVPSGINKQMNVVKELYPLILQANSRLFKKSVLESRKYQGFGVIKNYPDVNYGIPVIIAKIRIDKTYKQDNIYKCYSSMCTHMNCFGNEDNNSPETYDNSDVFAPGGDNIISCRCHGSTFDASNDGIPTRGPAERRLKQYPCSFDAVTGILTINF